MSNVYPRNFSHIGISVPDLEKAVDFYTKVMGWYLIMAPTDIEEDDNLFKSFQMAVARMVFPDKRRKAVG